jgi:hypothetical protein
MTTDFEAIAQAHRAACRGGYWVRLTDEEYAAIIAAGFDQWRKALRDVVDLEGGEAG